VESWTDHHLQAAPTCWAEFPGPTSRIHPFTSLRFHVLLNSLFKVLFNFPSRYLSAIGLVPVFSLRWSLPPTLGCIPKQPDSEEARCRRVQRRYGPDTRSGYGHDQEDFGAGARLSIGFLYTTFPAGHLVGGFGAGLFPLHSPLLRESLLVSFPPLTDMLKFSGYSRLIRGRMVCNCVRTPPSWHLRRSARRHTFSPPQAAQNRLRKVSHLVSPSAAVSPDKQAHRALSARLFRAMCFVASGLWRL
jgi:hypothetical protein